MDEIEKRLRETSENCFNCYEAWQKNKKDSAAREALQDSIHELRKVSSRLEIELAISERDEMTQKPIPIPPHRASKRRGGGPSDDHGEGDADDSRGNADPDAGSSGVKTERKPSRRRPPSGGAGKKASSGGNS